MRLSKWFQAPQEAYNWVWSRFNQNAEELHQAKDAAKEDCALVQNCFKLDAQKKTEMFDKTMDRKDNKCPDALEQDNNRMAEKNKVGEYEEEKEKTLDKIMNGEDQESLERKIKEDA